MPNPRDPTFTGRLTYNGQPLTDRQQLHLDAIEAAAEGLRDAMHNAEGSTNPGQHQEHVFITRRMNIAATHLEIAVMMGRKAALE